MNGENKSIFWGGLVTILIAGLFFVYFHSINRNTGTITEVASTTEYKQVDGLTTDLANELPVQYTIQKGDSLWKIAQTVYGDGDLWTEVHENNKNQITNPQIIEVGTKIIIPKIENLPEMKSYTVQKGDSLWKIAQSQCGSGYAWTSIASQNQLVNPLIIHAGNELRFRCVARGT